MTTASTLDLACKGGARNLGRDDIGEISAGLAADFVAWQVEDNLYCAGEGAGAAGVPWLCW
jgi:cytosine/adenosine deaminase-related metal-dependent hydrolase